LQYKNPLNSLEFELQIFKFKLQLKRIMILPLRLGKKVKKQSTMELSISI